MSKNESSVLYTSVPVESLKASTDHVRKTVDKATVDALAPILRDAFTTSGHDALCARQPILARNKGNGEYEIIDGHTRVEAIRKLIADKLVPEDTLVAVTLENSGMTDRQAHAAQLSSFARKNLKPSEKVLGLANARNKYKYSPEELATFSGDAIDWVNQQLTIATLPPEVLEQWDIGAKGATSSLLFQLASIKDAKKRAAACAEFVKACKEGKRYKLPAEAKEGEGEGGKAKPGRPGRDPMVNLPKQLAAIQSKVNDFDIPDTAKYAVNFMLANLPPKDIKGWDPDKFLKHVMPGAYSAMMKKREAGKE